MGSDKMKAQTIRGVFSDQKDADPFLGSRVANEECFDMDNDQILQKQLLSLNFDLAIVYVFPPCQCMTFIPLKLNIPFLTMQASIELEWTRVPVLPSFVPWSLMLASDKMSFTERLQNTFFTTLSQVQMLSPFPAVRNLTLLEKYNRDPSVNNWSDLLRKGAIHFAARGSILEYPVPLMPNVINIECLTCKPAKELSSDVKKMIESADGIIVFSFGSQVSELPDNVAQKFLKAFAKRPELILWRYTGKLPGKVPSNVKQLSWLPQNDLLAHPKTKLFITHSGNNGQYEAVYHGSPMLAFPLFAEQHHNAHRIVVHGYGLECDIRTFTEEELEEKMKRIISEPYFREATQKASRILKSQPMSAQENAAFWIEHVLLFGHDHLHSYALKMPWYSFYMFDILLFAQLLIFLSAFLLILIVRVLYRRFCSSKQKVKKN